MKKYLTVLVTILLLSLASCGNKDTSIRNLKMLEGGKTFAVPTGTAADQLVLKKFPDATFIYLNSILDCALAVKGGKADAAVYDLPVLKNIAAKNDGMEVLSELLLEDQYGFAVQLTNVSLKNTIDQVLSELKSDGTYDEMNKRWFPSTGAPGSMPELTAENTEGTLLFGTSAVTEPMSFVDANRKVTGFDIEFASYIARKLNKKLEVVDMEFGSMLPALISGKVDMIGAGLSITEERAKKVLFSVGYYQSGIAALVQSGKQKGKDAPIQQLAKIEELNDKKLGVLLGSVHDVYATKNFPDAVILQYQNVPDLLNAVSSGKADVAFYDDSFIKEVLEKNQQLAVFQKNLFSFDIGAGFTKKNRALREQFNTFLREIRANGVYADMTDRWFEKGISDMPSIESKNTSGQLKVGVVSDLGMPFSLIKNGQLCGFDIELASRFAAYLHKECVPIDLQFGSLISSLSTNKIDMITSSMTITEERKKQIDFSDPYYVSGVSVIALKNRIKKQTEPLLSTPKPSFFQKVTSSFYNNLLFEKRYLLILNGLWITVLISIFAGLFGSLLGGLICYFRMSASRILSGFAKFYIALLRGTPVLVLLMIIYYVVFASVNINPVIVAIFAFGLNFGAYVSEMFRTSIEGIDKGQTEAGIASGFTKLQTFVHIIFPQALRSVLPVYKGEFISLVKMTSVVGYIAVQDLTKASDIIRSRTFDAFFPLLMTAFIYLILAWMLTWALGYVEISVDPKQKRTLRMRGAKA